jgi:fatty acid desaturase
VSHVVRKRRWRVAVRSQDNDGVMAPRMRLDWPTVLVAIAIGGGFVGLTANARSIPGPFLVVGLAVLSAWHGSLQHELIHGHMSRQRWVRTVLGLPTVNLWLPFLRYEESHLRHHRDDHLTDPTDDPESWYRTGADWSDASPALRAVWWCNRTLLGRLMLGPTLAVFGFLRSELVSLRDPSCRRSTTIAWAAHVPMTVVTLWWLMRCDVIWWHYLLGAVYGGSSLTLFRSFAEHRWMPDGRSKTAMVHTNAVISLLYLNNNLHLAHHLRVGAPWYRLPGIARELGISEIAAAGSGSYSSYGQVIRQFLLRPFCQPVHPPAVGAMAKPAPWRTNSSHMRA